MTKSKTPRMAGVHPIVQHVLVKKPGGKCPHGRQQSQCKECGGKGVCPHGRLRHRCKPCGGASICVHQKMRDTCRECQGPGICEHNRRRSDCRECGGVNVCEHDRLRAQCKECLGSAMCHHGRKRSTCKECDGSQICEHNRQRHNCIDCDGASICHHGKRRCRCHECGGSSLCEHNITRAVCRVCNPSCACQGEACSIYEPAERRLAQIDGLCCTCWNALNPIVAKLKIRAEHLVLAEVERILPRLQKESHEYIWDCPVRGVQDCTKKKPDSLWVHQNTNRQRASMHLEIDESGDDHEDCDTRVADIQKAAESEYHYLVRVNVKDCIKRVRASNNEPYYKAVDPTFQQRMGELCDKLAETWERVKAFEAPTADTYKVKLGF